LYIYNTKNINNVTIIKQQLQTISIGIELLMTYPWVDDGQELK